LDPLGVHNPPVTEQNLDLETRSEELRETCGDLEAISDVNDQLLEHAREVEKELRQEADLKENRIRDSEKQIENLKYTIADFEKTIIKFRELVKQLQVYYHPPI
jgi:dynactin 1